MAAEVKARVRSRKAGDFMGDVMVAEEAWTVAADGGRQRLSGSWRSTVEHPFASLKYRIFGDARFLLRGLKGAQAEISLATAVYNLKRMMKVLGGERLVAALTT